MARLDDVLVDSVLYDHFYRPKKMKNKEVRAITEKEMLELAFVMDAINYLRNKTITLSGRLEQVYMKVYDEKFNIH